MSILSVIRRKIHNYLRTHRVWRKRKINGKYKYTIVAPTYNMEKYLDPFIKSIENQLLDFKNNIHLLFVDDGSTDSSAIIIKKWLKKYPDNISYYYKENGGLNSARNYGLERTLTPWVSFMDPDDFIDTKYYLTIDHALADYHDPYDVKRCIHILACNPIIYLEKNKKFYNNHPLRFKFEKKITLLPFDGLGKTIQMFVNSAVFSMDEIRRQRISFSEHNWPTYDDAHFVLRFMQNFDYGNIAFAKYPYYYYRKRINEDSQSRTGHLKKEFYLDLMEQGCLDNLQSATGRFNGVTPLFVQQTLLYFFSWTIRSLVNKPAPSCLHENEIDKFYSLLKKCFTYIDRSTIEEFDPNINRFLSWLKIGTLGLLKSEQPSYYTVYVDSVDVLKRNICLVYFCHEINSEYVYINGTQVNFIHAKTSKHTFLGHNFVLRRQLWIHVSNDAEILRCEINGIETFLYTSKKNNRLPTVNIKRIMIHHELLRKKNLTTPHSNAWVFMDRDVHADDNAEHFYRYVMNYHPEQTIYFVLRKDSHDWNRLKKENFNLIEFGSKDHETILRGCSKIISSHADHYVTDYFKNMCDNKDFIFLPHGVTVHDVSSWLNTKKMALWITTHKQEYNLLTRDMTPYHIPSQKVILTGYPRQDIFLPSIGYHNKILLVMPTWRQNLTGKIIGKGNARQTQCGFATSRFAQAWKKFLTSSRLRELTNKSGYTIRFFSHENIRPYLKELDLPSYVEVVTHQDNIKIPQLFHEATFMVTDYSGVAFEMAYIKKAVIYFQFDRDEVFSGAHIYQKYDFDFDSDGFGPVVTEEDELLAAVENHIKANGTASALYLSRMEKAFPHRDGKNCERVYKAIMEQDCPIS